jgi:hypothetical protein
LPDHGKANHIERHQPALVEFGGHRMRGNDWWPLLLSIAILAPVFDLAEPERCRSHGDLGAIREILAKVKFG